MKRAKCDLCGRVMVTRKATAEQPYRDVMSGLENVFLVGIEVRECERCGAKVPIIPKVAALHKAIARHLVFKSGLLTGKEVKFLRKNFGIQAKEFAALIGVAPAHLSRVENGKTEAFSTATDKLARAVAVAASDGQIVKKLLLNTAGEKTDGRLNLFGLRKNQWEKLAA